MRAQCRYCGYKASTVTELTAYSCRNSPNGKHVFYEGGEQSQYECKYCGYKGSTISALTAYSCRNSPNGKHEPAVRLGDLNNDAGALGRTQSKPVERRQVEEHAFSSSSGSDLSSRWLILAVLFGMGFALVTALWNHFTGGNQGPSDAPPAPAASKRPSVAASQMPLKDSSFTGSSAPVIPDESMEVRRATAVQPQLNESNGAEPITSSIIELSPEAVVTDIMDTDLRIMAKNFRKQYSGKMARYTGTVVRKNPREELLVFKGGGFVTTAYDVQVGLNESSQIGFKSVNIGDRITVVGTLDRIVTPPFGVGSNSIRIAAAQITARSTAVVPKRH